MDKNQLIQERKELVDDMVRLAGSDHPHAATLHAQYKKRVEVIDVKTGASGTSLGVRAYPQPRRDYNLKAFDDAEDAYRFGMFMAAAMGNEKAKSFCTTNGIPVAKAQAEGVGASGGFLVPDAWLSTLISLMEQFGVFRRNANIIPMSRDSLHWPRRIGGLNAYFIGEGAAPTESTATWDDVTLTAQKMACLIRVSNELLEDAVVDVGDLIMREIALAMATKEDDCILNGDGTNTFGKITGFLDSTKLGASTAAASVFTATGHATLDAVTLKDLTNFIGYLPQYALDGAVFICNQQFATSVFGQLMASGSGNTLSTLAYGSNGQATPKRFLGFPIIVSQKMPSLSSPSGKFGCLFGNINLSLAFGERRGLTVKRSTERFMDTDQLGILATQRVAITVHGIGSPITTTTLVTTSATASGNVLTFAGGVPTSITAGMVVTDFTTGSVIPFATTVASTTSTTVTMSAAVTGAGVGNGDTIRFAPSSYGSGAGPMVALKIG
jgi:HK97 family phage major capsid protein